MKLFKQIILILIIFLKTGNILSANNLFSVNNIILEKKDKIPSEQLANQAIRKGFNQLMKKILMQEDLSKISTLNSSNIKELVTYYNISKNPENQSNEIIFNVAFDKDKIHDLFYKKKISYSDITDKEFFILPILLKGNEIFIFSNNYFHENWNEINRDELIEFILPIENIEIIQIINQGKKNLLDLNLELIFREYVSKNVALILIEQSQTSINKIYMKSRVQDKIISKSFNLKKENIELEKFNEKIIYFIKDEIINLVKSRNLIDIRTPSFLNAKLNLDKKNNLFIFNSKIRKVDLIDKIFVQEFNKDWVNLKIKYLGKLEKIINELKKENIELKLINDQWSVKIL